MGVLFSRNFVVQDWIIPDFQKAQLNVRSMKFSTESAQFRLILHAENATYANLIWRQNLSLNPTKLATLEISLMARDGSEKLLCSKQNVSYQENDRYLGPILPNFFAIT